MLAAATPAAFIAFDLLALGDHDYTVEPFEARRRALSRALSGCGPFFHITPTTDEPATAQRWFDELECAGFDGIIAKPMDTPYLPGKRVMFKIKHQRTADCVVAGYRVHKSSANAVGSLLLGLYDTDGTLAPVGVIGAFPMVRRRELFIELQSLATGFDEHPWQWADQGAVSVGRRDGTPARTWRSFPSGPKGWSRFVTTTWKAPVSGIPHSSFGGDRTATRGHAHSRSWTSLPTRRWAIFCRLCCEIRTPESARARLGRVVIAPGVRAMITGI